MDHLDVIARWSGRRPVRLSVPGTEPDGDQRIEVDFEDGHSLSVRARSVNAAWRVLRARLMMRAV